MAILIEDYSPIYQGDTQVSFAPVFRHKDQSPVDLTGATITMKMLGALDTAGSAVVKTCDPTQWGIDDAGNGKAHYQWQAADVDTVGIWTLYITITIQGQPVHADTKLVQILPIV